MAGFYGVLAAGGVVVPLPPDIDTDRLGVVLDRCEIDLVLTAGRVSGRLNEGLGGAGKKVLLSGGPSPPTPLPKRARGVAAASRNDLAAVVFTAGSTGTPKGVMLSHGNFLANAASIIEYLGITRDDRALALLPFHHAYGNSVMQTHLLTGATLVQAGSVLFPNSIVEAIDRRRLTSFSGVPEMYRMLLGRSDLGRRPLPSLRCMTAAGGRLPPQLAAEVARRIAPARLFIMYGQTEAAARIAYLEPDELARRPGSVGRGIPGVEVQIVDAKGRRVPPGNVGELRARGPNVMLGYWRDPEGTRRVLRRGWLYTGDLGTVDGDGYIQLQGRASELVKISGHRVHPGEIEGVLARRLPVENIAVVACETESMGTRLALFFQPAPDREAVTPDEVLRFCRGTAASRGAGVRRSAAEVPPDQHHEAGPPGPGAPGGRADCRGESGLAMNDLPKDIEGRLLDWCRGRFGSETPIATDTDLLAEGLLDSLLVMDLAAFVKKEFGRSIDNEEISPRNFRSVGTLAALVARGTNGRLPCSGR